jgi:reductive dehalogenase
MTHELTGEETTVNDAGEIGLPSGQVDEAPDPAPVYRNQRKRYPWWVKSVNEPTIATDRERHRRMDAERLTLDLVGRFYHKENRAEVVNKTANLGLPQYIGVDKAAALGKKGWARQKRWLQENSPGFRHEDWALYHAAQSVQYNLGYDFYELTDKSAFVNVCKRYGLEPWKGSKLEASQTVEKAAIALGASQVGFAQIDPMYLYEGASYPPEMKYVIVTFIRWSPEGDKRRDTILGGADNRICSSRQFFLDSALRNFIRGLGYRESVIYGLSIPLAVNAGMGELGRANRMVSPVHGMGGRITALVTDLPLAIDKPIDFGLQAFCRRCRKCAEACPVGALSMEKEPSWEPEGAWNAPGKRAYYENSVSCLSYMATRGTGCSLCLAACPWTKQSKTSLHYFAKALGAKLPFLAPAMVFLDDLFGYGPTSNPELYEKWWDLDLHEYGLD